MKVDVTHIIVQNAKSLNDAPSRRARLFDGLTIYGLPLISGIVASVACVIIDSGFYGISISVFAVFSALLLNTQIAIFGIFGRDRPLPMNEKSKAAEELRLKLRNDLIVELNTNVSYLMILAVLAMFISCLFYIIPISNTLETFLTCAIFVHFAVVIVIVIKRSFALFANEYAG